jgi:hypothetical protein
VSHPSPDERLRERLAHLPDACRALLAAMERQAARGGGEVTLRLHVTRDGEIESVELPARYERALLTPRVN